MLVFHALSGSQHAAGVNPSVPGLGDRWTPECQVGWWDAFIGPGKAINTDKFCVLCVNYLGGCYGSTGPSSINPATGQPYGGTFPSLTVSDLVDSQVRLLDHLGVEKVHAVIGGSLGGMMCVTFATRYPQRVDIVVPIAAGLGVTSLQRIHNLEQIYAIEKDANYRGGDYYDGAPPDTGLALARMISHKTFVSLHMMEDRARKEVIEPRNGFTFYGLTHPVESYLLHQGRKFVKRFDANTYLRILKAWQQYDVAAESGEESLEDALARCRHHRYMVFTIDSDVCFYPEEQGAMIRQLKRAGVRCRRITVHSEKGHDAFLLEPELFKPHLVFTLEEAW